MKTSIHTDCSTAFVRILLVAFLASLGLQGGCVRKRMTFRTNPAGAMVYVDKQPVGLTPVSTGFTYYGNAQRRDSQGWISNREISRKMHAPWYQIPPLDFVSDTLWPFESRDERIIDVQLTPEFDVPEDALIASGEQLRLQAGQGIAVTPPPTVVQPSTPILAPAPVGIVPSPTMVPGPPVVQAPQPTFGQRAWNTLFPYGAPLSFPSTQVTPGGGFRPPTDNE